MAPKRKQRPVKEATAKPLSPGAALVAARWRKTTPAQRSAIARKLAKIRWKKKRQRRPAQ